MPEHPNVALWRNVHQAFSRGDLETLQTYFTDDVVCHIGGAHPLSGEKTGIGGLLAYVQALTEMAGGTLRLEPHQVMARWRSTKSTSDCWLAGRPPLHPLDGTLPAGVHLVTPAGGHLCAEAPVLSPVPRYVLNVARLKGDGLRCRALLMVLSGVN